jgi:hypothetical protein
LATSTPSGLFPEGIRFQNPFEGRRVAGPFTGARFFGTDLFLLRPDGVGEITAPEVLDTGAERIALDVRGYVVPLAGIPFPPLEAVAAPGFEFPDIDFRVTGSASIRTATSGYKDLNQTIAIVEGTVNMATGRRSVAARAA